MDFLKAFMMIGDLENERTPEDKVAYETRIVFATMKSKIPGWEQPANWDSLPIEERNRRLTKLREVI